jgi:MFS family permease
MNARHREHLCHHARPVNDRTGSWKGVWFGVGIAAFAAYQQFKLPVVLPVLLAQYGYERTLAGGFVAVYALAGLLLSVWMGRFVERRGPLTPVLAAMALIVAGSLITLAQPQLGLLVLAGRALEGLGFTALAVSGPVLATANAPVRHLPIVIGLSAAWIPLGQLAATGLAPIALATTGWQLLWWLGIAGAALAVGAALRLRLDPRVVLAPVRRGAGASSSTLSAHDRGTLTLVACIFGLWSCQYFGYMTWLPQYLVDVHGLAVHGALLSYVVPVTLVAVFNVVVGVLLRAGVALGALMSGAIATQVLVWLAMPITGSDWSGVLSLVIYGIGAGIVPGCLFAAPNAILGAGRGTAAAFGILMAGRNLGVLVGPVLIALVSGAARRWYDGALVYAAITCGALLLSFALAARLNRPRARTAA